MVVACCYCDFCFFGLSWLNETEREDEREDEEKCSDLPDDSHFDELGVVLVLCEWLLVDGWTEIW